MTAIEEGITVVIDRYYYSGIVYSAAKGNPSLSLEWARCPEVGLPLPDLCILLDITPEAVAKRDGFGDEKYETTVMQKRVRELFYELMKGPDGQRMKVIDAGRTIETVEKDVMEIVDEVMGDLQNQGLRSIPNWDENSVE